LKSDTAKKLNASVFIVAKDHVFASIYLAIKCWCLAEFPCWTTCYVSL